MKSIKPGRGPSFLGGIMGIAVAVFGVIWTVVVICMGGGLFALCGIVFTAMAIAVSVVSFKNATGKNRYSSFDITDEKEEPDPLNERFGEKKPETQKPDEPEKACKYCPYCGAKVEGDFEFCGNCGKRLP